MSLPRPRRPLRFRLRRPLVAAAAALAAMLASAGPAAAQPGGFGDPGGLGGLGLELARVTPSLEPAGPVAPGGTVDVRVRLVIEKHWHIQAGVGSGDETDGFVSTSVALELPEGWTAGDVAWPPSTTYTLGDGDAAISFKGYEGTVTATIPVTAPAGASDGDVPFTARIGFQACDDAVCEMPEETTARGTLVVSAAAAAARAAADAARFEDDVRLLAETAWYEGGVLPGRTASLGVLLDVAPGWHLQAGEGSGDLKDPAFIATTISLELPDGWTAGDVQWPPADENGWYGGRSVAIVPVTAPEGVTAGTVPFEVIVGYQACNDEGLCEFPASVTLDAEATVLAEGDAEVLAPLPDDVAALFARTFQAGRGGDAAAGGQAAADEHAEAGFSVKRDKWWISLVLVVAGMAWMAIGTFRISKKTGVRIAFSVIALLGAFGSYTFVRGMTAESAVTWTKYSPAAFETARAEDKTVFIKFTADWCANCQVNERLILGNEEAVAELTQPDVAVFKVDFTGSNPDGDAKKEELGGGGIPLIAVYTPDEPEPVILRGQLAGAGPVISALRGTFESADSSEGRQVFDIFGWQFSVAEGAIAFIMVLAFIAGFLMNFTPCVLPVIPIKILSLQAHAKDPARCLLLGLVFSAGIVALYAILGLLMAGLVGGIEKLDWGQHFEKWWLNALIAVIILAMGIGMMGVFEIRLPQFLTAFNPQSDSAVGSFGMGVFTAVLSTPCTGPLLGATVAWSATQPPAVAFLTLVVMGLGMAAPYVVLVAFPGLLKKMPRTGPGSELLKQVMGLLMLAVAVWFGGTALAALGA